MAKRFKKRKRRTPRKKHLYLVENFFFGKSLEPGESIKYVVHVHPITFHLQLSKFQTIYLVIPAILWFLFPALKLLCLGAIVYGIFKILMLAWRWYHQCFLVTNKGVISIRSNDFWHVNMMRLEYTSIGGVTYDIDGAFRTLMNYGDLTLEKAGGGGADESGIVTLKGAKNPLEAELTISSWQKAHMEELSVQNQTDFQQLLEEMTKVYAKAKA